jgi:hypothetical protein
MLSKSTQLIPNEIVLRDFDILSGYIRLSPKQVSMIMGVSLSTLEKNRSNGHPLPHIKEGGKILYRLQDVRNYLQSQTIFKNACEAYQARQEEYEFKILGCHLL